MRGVNHKMTDKQIRHAKAQNKYGSFVWKNYGKINRLSKEEEVIFLGKKDSEMGGGQTDRQLLLFITACSV